MAEENGPVGVRYGSTQARWVLIATVLGSGIAFLDGTIVNVALPAISGDLDVSLGGLQWVVNAYLVTLSALLLLGGSLGDRYGRRTMFVAGLLTFTLASLLCAVAPSAGFLVAARALQGIGGALLVPASLSIISSTFHPDDRGRAIGAWSGMAGTVTAIGPFLGGWLIDAVSWRLVFLINLPLAAAAIAIALRHVPDSRDRRAKGIDVAGAVLVTAALAGLSYGAIERGGAAVAAAVLGAVALVAFVLLERSIRHPMLPLELFRSRQFTGANITTFAVYAGLGGALFLVVLRLQVSLGYSALEAGAALTPFTVLMLLLSPGAGQLSQRTGPRLPLTVGPLTAAAGLLLFGAISAGDRYMVDVLGPVVLFGLGMALTVAPLTTAVFASVAEERAGIASGVNNAVSRLASLLAVAVLPVVAGISTQGSVEAGLDAGYGTALRLCAVLCASGGVAAAALVRTSSKARPVVHPSPLHACHDPGLARPASRPEAVAGPPSP